jgi:hypothetical protein
VVGSGPGGLPTRAVRQPPLPTFCCRPTEVMVELVGLTLQPDVVVPRRAMAASGASAENLEPGIGTQTHRRSVIRLVLHEATSTSVKGMLQHNKTLPAAISRGRIPPA